MSNDLLHDPVSRRAFLARMTAAGLGTAAAALIAGCGGSSSNGSGNNGGGSGGGNGTTTFADQANFPNIPGQNENIVVLNFALTLETLEADLYRQALNIAAGKDVGTPLPADASSYTQAVGNGSVSAALAPVGFLYLKQYAYVEAAHRDFLRGYIPTLGGTPVPANPKGYNSGLAPGADLEAAFGRHPGRRRNRRVSLSGRGGLPDARRLGRGGVHDLFHRVAPFRHHQLVAGQH